jgi:hypothetical protein
MANIIHLRIEGSSSSVKLAWDCGPAEDPWSCVYHVDRGTLKQQSEFVRTELRKLATLRVPLEGPILDSDRQYGEILHGLLVRGAGLRANLFRPVDQPASVTAELQEYIEEASRAWTDPVINVKLCDDAVYLPWSFITIASSPKWPRTLKGNIADFDDFWIGRFQVTVKYQVNNSRLPSSHLPHHDCICAVHEDLFARAHQELRKKDKQAAEMLDQLLSDSFVKSDWEEIRKDWDHVKDNSDSVIYVFGHSNGELIALKDDCDDSIHGILPVSQFSENFRKADRTASASIVVLNGCRTSAPTTSDPWPASFLKATRGPGFYGFVGTEAQVPNDRACLFGTHLLKRLRSGTETLGQAFDDLRQEKDLFPLSLIFTCFANREFRLAANPPRHPQATEIADDLRA